MRIIIAQSVVASYPENSLFVAGDGVEYGVAFGGIYQFQFMAAGIDPVNVFQIVHIAILAFMAYRQQGSDYFVYSLPIGDRGELFLADVVTIRGS